MGQQVLRRLGLVGPLRAAQHAARQIGRVADHGLGVAQGAAGRCRASGPACRSRRRLPHQPVALATHQGQGVGVGGHAGLRRRPLATHWATPWATGVRRVGPCAQLAPSAGQRQGARADTRVSAVQAQVITLAVLLQRLGLKLQSAALGRRQHALAQTRRSGAEHAQAAGFAGQDGGLQRLQVVRHGTGQAARLGPGRR